MVWHDDGTILAGSKMVELQNSSTKSIPCASSPVALLTPGWLMEVGGKRLLGHIFGGPGHIKKIRGRRLATNDPFFAPVKQ